MPSKARGSRIVQALVAVGLPPLLFSIVYAVRTLNMPSTAHPALPEGPYPGDNIVPDAVMIYDQVRVANCTPADVWPWVLQLGKGRGGWYTPESWEKYLPQSWHAPRKVIPDYQRLKPGVRVEDYDFKADAHFIVSEVDAPHALVYKGDRHGAFFSWALILHDISTRDNSTTLIHLRFRGKIAATGLKQKLIVWSGGWIDYWTTAPMLAGMQERAEANKSFCSDRCPGTRDYWCRKWCIGLERRKPLPYKVFEL